MPRRRRNLVVVDDDRTGVFAQPVDALLDDAVGLAELLDANQITVVAVAVGADRNVEIHAVVDFVRLLLAQIPLDAGAAQHRAGETERQGAFGRHHANADGALLPDAVVGQQGFVFVDIGRETLGEVIDEIEQRTLTVGVHRSFIVASLRVCCAWYCGIVSGRSR